MKRRPLEALNPIFGAVLPARQEQQSGRGGDGTGQGLPVLFKCLTGVRRRRRGASDSDHWREIGADATSAGFNSLPISPALKLSGSAKTDTDCQDDLNLTL